MAIRSSRRFREHKYLASAQKELERLQAAYPEKEFRIYPVVASALQSPARRCDTNQADIDGKCLACGAADGDACAQPKLEAA